MNRGVGVSQKRKIVTDNFFKVWHNKKRWFFIMIKIPKKRKKNKVIFRHLYKMIQNDDKKAPKSAEIIICEICHVNCFKNSYGTYNQLDVNIKMMTK